MGGRTVGGWWSGLASEPARLLIWGLVPRGIALVYLVCFASLLGQVVALLGERGLAPAGSQLDALRRDLPWRHRLRLSPGLLWLSTSDAFLRGLVLLGMGAAALAVVGGPLARPAMFACWLVLLSLKNPLRMYYPWDNLLLEAGLLCLFLPGWGALPQVDAAALPPPLVAFAFDWTLFRVVFGFGKTKFPGIERKDLLYLRYFLQNMPIVTRVGWRLAKAPRPLHVALLAGVAVVELLCPVAVLFAGPLRPLAAVMMVGQMVGIQLTGNFGYFNLLTAVFCIAALDTTAGLGAALASGTLLTASNLPFTLLFFGLLLPGGAAYLVFNNWFSCGWLHWPAFERLRPGPLKAFLAVLRAVEPLGLLHAYGVFGSRPAPPVRWVTVVEGQGDDGRWRPFRWRFNPTDEASAPRFVAPHHPRLDHLSFYDAVGVDGTGWFHVLSFNDPYRLSRVSLLDTVMERVRDPASPVRGLFAADPFPGAVPAQVRTSLYRFTATTAEVQQASGRWWDVARIGCHLPPRVRDETLFDEAMPPPELWHPEARRWRQRAGHVTAVSEAELDAFFDDLLPVVRAAATAPGPLPAYDLRRLPDLALGLRKRWSRAELYHFRLTLGRLTAAVMAPLEVVAGRPARRFWRDVVGLGAPGPRPEEVDLSTDPEGWLQAVTAWPNGPLRSGFHLFLAARWTLLSGGRAAWERLAWTGFEAGKPIPTEAALPPGAHGSMAAAAAAVGLDLVSLRSRVAGLDVPRGFFLEGALDYDGTARTSARLAVLYSSEETYTPIPTGLIPGVFDLAWELLRIGELPQVEGWGADAAFLPRLDPPRMTLGEDGIWRRVDEVAGQATVGLAAVPHD